jgi:hypothetical protein
MQATLTSPNESPPNTRRLGIVAVFESPDRAEAAVTALQTAGFDPGNLSIIAKDAHSGEHLLGYATAGDRTRFWGRSGPSWDRLARRLRGAAVVFAPFIGYVVMLGPVVQWLIDDEPRHGSAEGATRLWRLLARVGVPSHDGVALESALREFDAALLVAGTPAEIDEARNLLRTAARRMAE